MNVLLQVEISGKAVELASKATEQLVRSSDQESFLVQLLFWLVLLFGGMLFALGYAVIRHLVKRNEALQQDKEKNDYIQRLTKPTH